MGNYHQISFLEVINFISTLNINPKAKRALNNTYYTSIYELDNKYKVKNYDLLFDLILSSNSIELISDDVNSIVPFSLYIIVDKIESKEPISDFEISFEDDMHTINMFT